MLWIGRATMLSNSRDRTRPANAAERSDPDSLVRDIYERCNPEDTFEDLKRRSAFSKEDRGLLRDWVALAASRAAKTTDTAPSNRVAA